MHSYSIEPRGRSKAIKKWRCSSLFHAFQQYEWRFSYEDLYSGKSIKGSSYAQSEAALNDLQEKLKNAVESGDNNACFKACEMILKWGGVLGSEAKGNKKILLEMREYLANYLKKAQYYFNGDCTLSPSYQLDLAHGSTNLVMNAGFTKIYSLLCEDFIIYDGRVGAALGRLVTKHLNTNYNEVPEGLKFHYGNAKNIKVNRNPSVGSHKFMALSTSSPVHIRNNLKANWIISALNIKEAKGFSEQKNPFRAFEAALFMIGYRM